MRRLTITSGDRARLVREHGALFRGASLSETDGLRRTPCLCHAIKVSIAILIARPQYCAMGA